MLFFILYWSKEIDYLELHTKQLEDRLAAEQKEREDRMIAKKAAAELKAQQKETQAGLKIQESWFYDLFYPIAWFVGGKG